MWSLFQLSEIVCTIVWGLLFPRFASVRLRFILVMGNLCFSGNGDRVGDPKKEQPVQDIPVTAEKTDQEKPVPEEKPVLGLAFPLSSESASPFFYVFEFLY